MTEETTTTTTTEERVARPEEILGTNHYRNEQSPQPLRCRVGRSAPDGGCQRDATTWMYPEDRDFPLCDEHARLHELADEANDWSLIQEITHDWLRMSRAWSLPELEQFAMNAHESAKEGYLKAHSKVELAREIADAPRRNDARVPAQLKREEEEELRRRMRRCDELNNSFTTIEDVPEGQITEDARRRTLAFLVEERERAHEEFGQYRAELGLEVKVPTQEEK